MILPQKKFLDRLLDVCLIPRNEDTIAGSKKQNKNKKRDKDGCLVFHKEIVKYHVTFTVKYNRTFLLSLNFTKRWGTVDAEINSGSAHKESQDVKEELTLMHEVVPS